MDNIGKIKDLIRNIGGGEETSAFFTAKVKSVEKDTCTVLVDDLELTEVRLRAVVDGEEEFLRITPKVGSMILVADLSDGEMRDLVVIKYTQVDIIELKRNKIDINITGGDKNEISIINEKTKINLKEDEINILNNQIEVNLKDNKINVHNGYSLKDAFNDLINEIKMITVPTAMGPSGIPVNNHPNFDKIRGDINGLLS